MPSLLSAEIVSMVFGGGPLGGAVKRALDRVTLRVEDASPSITAIVGESGSGKTTLTRLLLGLATPTEGHILYKGRPLGGMSRAEIITFRREVQAVFQDPFAAYNPFYRIDRALTLPLRRFGLSANDNDARERAAQALETVGLRPGDTLGRYPHQLSGGQRQRIMIARALLLEPRIIIADEPASMVDASLRATILNTLHKLKQDRGISLIYVTHDLTTAYQIADRIVVMNAGAIVEEGDPDSVILKPQHPYTQALIAAIPTIDPDGDWLADEPREAGARAHG